MKKKSFRFRYGFVFIELIVVASIIATLLGIVYVRSTDIERRAPLTSSVDTVIADLGGQQTKAMVGESNGSGIVANYGIHFETNTYSLFTGASFNSADTTNAVFTLPTNITVNHTTLLNNTVNFAKGSGEVAGYTEGANTVTLRQGLSAEEKTITINRYGIVWQVQ